MSFIRRHLILCIDDDATALQVRTLVLEHNGYSVLSASSATEGMALFRTHPVELVLLDHFLVDGCGTTVAAEMKRLKPDIPVIILSGAIELSDGVRAEDLFINKVEPTEVVLEKIATLLQRDRRIRKRRNQSASSS